ncbi:MAG: hypothetical protein KC619_18670 [Myxococcales bacterium]|nr:hypothetical protein [Myxococcales bacterium]
MERRARIAGLALLLSACTAEEIGGPAGYATARTEMRPLVSAACQWMFGCCSTDERVHQLGDFVVDEADCTERLIDAIAAGVPLDLEQPGLSSDPAEGLLVLALSIDEGRVSVNQAAVQRCADATASRTCNTAVAVDPSGRCTPGAAPGADPCDPTELLEGRQAIGEACNGPWECLEGLRCIDAGIAAVCARRALEGETCFGDAECGAALVCDWSTGRCAPGARAGEACAFADPTSPIPGTESVRCAPGLTCDPVALVCGGGFCAAGAPCADVFADTDCPVGSFCVGNTWTTPSCRAPGETGAPCFKAADCQSAWCDAVTETCAVRLGVGASCFSHDECASGFCPAGACAPSVAPGQPCPSFSHAECAGGYCDTTDPVAPVCRAYAADGGPCPLGLECDPEARLSCIDGTCLRPPFDVGVRCTNGAQCASGLCYAGSCSAGAALGSSCRTDGTVAPCAVGAFCDADEGVDGTCAALRRTGEACSTDAQCWGSCVTRFGQRMCDATPAADEAWCDGP